MLHEMIKESIVGTIRTVNFRKMCTAYVLLMADPYLGLAVFSRYEIFWLENV